MALISENPERGSKSRQEKDANRCSSLGCRGNARFRNLAHRLALDRTRLTPCRVSLSHRTQNHRSRTFVNGSERQNFSEEISFTSPGNSAVTIGERARWAV